MQSWPPLEKKTNLRTSYVDRAPLRRPETALLASSTEPTTSSTSASSAATLPLGTVGDRHISAKNATKRRPTSQSYQRTSFPSALAMETTHRTAKSTAWDARCADLRRTSNSRLCHHLYPRNTCSQCNFTIMIIEPRRCVIELCSNGRRVLHNSFSSGPPRSPHESLSSQPAHLEAAWVPILAHPTTKSHHLSQTRSFGVP